MSDETKTIRVTQAQAQHLQSLDLGVALATERAGAALKSLCLGHGIVEAQLVSVDPTTGDIVLKNVKEG